MTRLKAFTLHIIASLLVFGGLLVILVWAWYPPPIFELEHGWRGLEIVAPVHLVLGPLLTLILFKPGKPGLRFDMSVVILLQLSALLYGAYNLSEARPLLLVYADEHFQPITATRLQVLDPGGAVARRWGGWTLHMVYVKMPDDPIKRADVLLKAIRTEGDVFALFDRYHDLRKSWKLALRDSVHINDYVSHKAAWKNRLDRLTARLGKQVKQLAFFPYIGREKRVFLVFDRKNARMLDYLDIPYGPTLVRRERGGGGV